MMRSWALPLALLATPAAAHQDACAEVSGLLAQLDLSRGEELAGADGRLFRPLYDECDTADTFAGEPLPEGVFCSTDPNRVEFLLHFPDGTVAFRAKAAVDADGAPVSRGPGAGPSDQPQTWLEFDGGSAEHFANAEDMPYIVVPNDVAGMSFRTVTGIEQGDLAVALYGGRCSFGLVGDSGPPFKLGEASMRVHEDLGNPQCAVAGEYPCTRLMHDGEGAGIDAGVTYLIFPHTRPAPLLSQRLDALALAAFNRARSFLRDFSAH